MRARWVSSNGLLRYPRLWHLCRRDCRQSGSLMESTMKRRRFISLVAGAPIAGSAGYLNLSSSSAKSSIEQGAATPIPGIDVRSAALLVMDYQVAWIQTLTDTDALLDRAANAIAIAR